jgi:hypothetical protein
MDATPDDALVAAGTASNTSFPADAQAAALRGVTFRGVTFWGVTFWGVWSPWLATWGAARSADLADPPADPRWPTDGRADDDVGSSPPACGTNVADNLM